MSRELKKQVCLRMLEKGLVFEIEVQVIEGFFSEKLVRECEVINALKLADNN